MKPSRRRPNRRARRAPGRARRLPAASDVEQLADWIAAARNPLIITGTLGRDPRESAALDRLADRFALPVVPFNTRYFALSSMHPMFMGSVPGPLLKDADLVLVWETDVPWFPEQDQPAAGARIVQIGEDPLYSRYPMRSFPSDLTIRSATCRCWRRWTRALADREADVAARHARLAATLREAACRHGRRRRSVPVAAMSLPTHG